MAKKIYTLQVDEKNLATSARSKAVLQKKSSARTGVENYGILEINNAGASKKVASVDKGFEKVISGNEKKAVKSELHKVDDYFDFSFRPNAKVEKNEMTEFEFDEEQFAKFLDTILNLSTSENAVELAKEEKAHSKTKKCAKKASVAKTNTEVITEVDNKTATILKVDSDHIEEIRTCQVQAEVCAYDNDAIYNIDVARIGSLFDCEKTMLN